jgi:hypothetical protein
MIRFEAVAQASAPAVAGAGLRAGPDHPTAAAAGCDGGDDGLPANAVVKRLGDEVRMVVEAGGESFTLRLDPPGSRALGAALIAAGGSGFYRTRR